MNDASRNPPSTPFADLTPHQSRLIEQDNARLRIDLAIARDQVRQLRLQLEQAKAGHRYALRQYATTHQFHHAAELDVTAEEGEAFVELERRVGRVENAYLLQQGRLNTMSDKLDAIKEVL